MNYIFITANENKMIEEEEEAEADNDNNMMKKSVHFCQVEIIELPIILGDNPSLSSGGPPMCVGWEPMRRSEFAIDFYEKHRPRRRATRRGLIISGAGRINFFLRCGYSRSEIDEATALAQQYKKQMTISKILNSAKAEVDDSFPRNGDNSSSNNKNNSSSSRDVSPPPPPPSNDTPTSTTANTYSDNHSIRAFRRKNSPTAEPPETNVQQFMVKARVWDPHQSQSCKNGSSGNGRGSFQPLVQPRRTGSPPSSSSTTTKTRSSRKTPIARNQSLPIHFAASSSSLAAGAHRFCTQHQRGQPPVRPSRVDSPPRGNVNERKRIVTTPEENENDDISVDQLTTGTSSVTVSSSSNCSRSDDDDYYEDDNTAAATRKQHIMTRNKSLPLYFRTCDTNNLPQQQQQQQHPSQMMLPAPPSRFDSPPGRACRKEKMMIGGCDRFIDAVPMDLQHMPQRKASISIVSPPTKLNTTTSAAAAATTSGVVLPPPPPPPPPSNNNLYYVGSGSSPPSITSPVQPRRKCSPPIENQKTIRRCI